jgi:hypothetical protein
VISQNWELGLLLGSHFRDMLDFNGHFFLRFTAKTGIG